MKILMVEDEKLIARPVEKMLRKNNYNVDLAFDGEEGLYLGLQGSYDLILLDIMMPKMDGFGVLQELRRKGVKTPVLMLTAKDQIEDKIKGLDEGADDYLAKPFDKAELLARMRALLRRAPLQQMGNTFRIGNLELDLNNLMLATQKGQEKLTKKEAQLLQLFIARGAVATSKELIIEKLWDFSSDADTSHVEYHISMLRKKLKQVEGTAVIKTIRGVGYLLEASHEG